MDKGFFKRIGKAAVIIGGVVGLVEGGGVLKKNIDLKNQQEKEQNSLDSLHHEEFVQWSEKVFKANSLKELPSLHWKAKPDFELNGAVQGRKEDRFSIRSILLSDYVTKNSEEIWKVKKGMYDYVNKFIYLFNKELETASSLEDMIRLKKEISELSFSPNSFIQSGVDIEEEIQGVKGAFEDTGRIVDGVYYGSDSYEHIEIDEDRLKEAMKNAWYQTEQGQQFFDPNIPVEFKDSGYKKKYLKW